MLSVKDRKCKVFLSELALYSYMIMFYKHGYIYYIKIIPPSPLGRNFFSNILLVDAVEGGRWVSGGLNIYIYIHS